MAVGGLVQLGTDRICGEVAAARGDLGPQRVPDRAQGPSHIGDAQHQPAAMVFRRRF